MRLGNRVRIEATPARGDVLVRAQQDRRPGPRVVARRDKARVIVQRAARSVRRVTNTARAGSFGRRAGGAPKTRSVKHGSPR